MGKISMTLRIMSFKYCTLIPFFLVLFNVFLFLFFFLPIFPDSRAYGLFEFYNILHGFILWSFRNRHKIQFKYFVNFFYYFSSVLYLCVCSVFLCVIRLIIIHSSILY